MKETIRVLLSEEEVDRRIKEVADQINRDYAGKEVHLICVLKGGVFFMCELAKRITVPVSLDFMSVSSYGDDTKSSGVVRIVKRPGSAAGRKRCSDRGGYHRFRKNALLSDRHPEKEKSEIRTPVYSARQAGAQSARCQSRLYLL